MGIRTRLTWRGAEAVAREKAGAARGVARAAEHVLQASRAVAPLEEGTMIRSSGTDHQAMRASIFYNTIYSRRQHEELTWAHDPGRRSKYLEGPLTEQAAVVRRIIADEIRDALR